MLLSELEQLLVFFSALICRLALASALAYVDQLKIHVADLESRLAKLLQRLRA